MIATGAGAASRQSIGTTVVGGMLAATLLSLGFVPIFYAVIEAHAGGHAGALRARAGSQDETAHGD